ncbi:MAG: cell division protein BolA [Porticoccaceae bacterium]|nr:cell division protein BolA [Porticoccaceae bacterium]
MNNLDVKAILEASLPSCEIEVQAQGNHFNIVVVGNIFSGKRPVQRQQLIYGALTEQISSGAIHAVNMKLFTPSEWQQHE